ncbi:Alpha/Beta hydrolase protein [Aspergillus novoparasiticus]|uniref:Alpha/Beta hydrolase protein n=1 Tax=Aspergillus novoparasiticus TaxID=986946 RepID=A0A5N6F9N9_9EURO|nr:Alpha/Beta hydrolase protein [Aspergillus novoparasiticus]
MLRAREVSYISAPVLNLKDPKARCPGFKQGVRVFERGEAVAAGARPFPVDTIMHESVPFRLSDGITIYFDIFLPAQFKTLNSSAADAIPAIVCWSPYGKQKGQQILDDLPMRAGVPKHMVSEAQKWEAPDPAEWIQYGYAIVNPDCRGCWTSEGDFEGQDYGEAFDCAELIEWLAVASLRPKGLAAIAPLEGASDSYRDTSVQDGITGPGRFEDWHKGFKDHPLYDVWWDNKWAFPEYIKTLLTWLRVHNTQEWPDFYTHQDDLRRFFDHYLLDRQDNGWDAMPQYRMAILDLGDPDGDLVNRPEREFPLKRTRYADYYLRKDNTVASFSYKFLHNQETTGYWTLHLSVSADIDDMEIYVQIEKYDSRGYRRGTQMIRPEGMKGKIIQQIQKRNIGLSSTGMLFSWGPEGVMRVGHAATLDSTLSVGPHLFFKHDCPKKLNPGEVRAIQIPLRPYGMFWKAGDEMRLAIKGSTIVPFPLPEVKPPPNPNMGPHRLHLSGCFLTVPHIPY